MPDIPNIPGAEKESAPDHTYKVTIDVTAPSVPALAETLRRVADGLVESDFDIDGRIVSVQAPPTRRVQPVLSKEYIERMFGGKYDPRTRNWFVRMFKS